MKFRSALVLVIGLVVVAFVMPASPARAQDTTDVYVVHGLNLGDQTAQGDGGTNVTVCADDAELIADFEFGQIAGPVALPTGTSVNIDVYGGASEDCAAPAAAPLITADVAPTGAAVALAATSSGGTLGLTAFPLNVSCTDEGNGRLTAAHASGDTGEVVVSVAGDAAGNLTFGNSLDAELPAQSYSVEVTLGGTPVVGPADIPVTAQNNQLVFVVGNIAGGTPTPVVPLLNEIPVPTCEPATTTTTAPAPPSSTTPPSNPSDSPGPSSAGAPLAITG